MMWSSALLMVFIPAVFSDRWRRRVSAPQLDLSPMTDEHILKHLKRSIYVKWLVNFHLWFGLIGCCFTGQFHLNTPQCVCERPLSSGLTFGAGAGWLSSGPSLCVAAMSETRRAAERFVADSVTCGDETRSDGKQRRRLSPTRTFSFHTGHICSTAWLQRHSILDSYRVQRSFSIGPDERPNHTEAKNPGICGRGRN